MRPPLNPDKILAELVLFLSYSSQDQPQAQTLESELVGLGAKVWFAGDSVAVGEEIESHVKDGLKESHASVVLLSRAAIRSPWVMVEVGATWFAGKPIIPVRIDVGVAELPDLFRNRLTCGWDERQERLIRGLAEIARRVREDSQAALSVSRKAREALGVESDGEPLVQLLADCLSPDISERRRAQAWLSREPGAERDAIVAAAERLTHSTDSRIRGEAYYLLGTVRTSKDNLARGEDFFREAIDTDDSLWVQANCAQVLKGMIPLTEDTVQRLQLLRSHARNAENNEQSELLYRVLDTLEAQSGSKR